VDAEDLGVLGFAWAFFYFVEALSGGGLLSAFVQCDTVGVKRRSSFFWLSLFLGIVGFVVMLALGLVVSNYVEIEYVFNAFLCLAAVLFFRMCGATHRAALLRGQRQRAIASSSLVASVLCSCLGVWLAVSGMGIWALLLKNLLQAIIENILIIVIDPWKPRQALDLEFIRYIIVFSMPIIGVQLVRLSVLLGQTTAIGICLGISALGLFEIVRKVPDVTVQFLGTMFSRFLIPFVSERRRFGKPLRGMFNLLFSVGIFSSTVMLFCIYPYADNIVIRIYGEQWVSGGMLFFFMMACALSTIVQYSLHSFIISLGHSRCSIVELCYLLVAFPFFFCALQFSLELAFCVLSLFYIGSSLHLYFYGRSKLSL